MRSLRRCRPAFWRRTGLLGAPIFSGEEYNSKGKVTRQTDPLGRETVFEYDTNEIDLLRVKQKNGSNYELLRSSTYNFQHQSLTMTDAAGQTTTYTYYGQGQVLTVTTPPRTGITENRTTGFAYDTDGYLQSVTRPATGATTSFTYDGYGRIRTVTDDDSYTLTTDYDALDRPTRVTYPDGTYDDTVYNRLDPEGHRDRLGRWNHTFHDALRRVVSTRDAAGRTTTQEWCTCGSLDKLIDSNGNVTAWERDLQGRVTREIRANGSDKEFTYEATTSRLRMVKDAKDQEIHHQYFLDGGLQQTSSVNALIPTPTVSFTHDAAYGRVQTMTDGTGTTSYGYHPIGLPPQLGAGGLASVDGPLANDTVSYGYDEVGRVLSRGLPGAVTTYGYDALGRMSVLTNSIGSFGFTYVGTSGRLQTMTYPNGQTSSYAYHPNSGDQRLQEIHHRASAGGATLSKFNYTYDAMGNIKVWTQQYEANLPRAYDLNYDPADQLTAAIYRTTDATPSVLTRYVYAYDPAGNRTGEQTDDVPFSASYDYMNRILSRQPGGPLLFLGTTSEPSTVTMAGQPAPTTATNQFEGRAQVPSGTSTAPVTATDPAGNTRTNIYQVSAAGATTSHTYDANGNLASRTEGGTTWTYEWNAEDRLTAVKQGATILASFTYDGEGRRANKSVGSVTTTYVYDGEDIVEERPTGGGTTRHFHGPGIDQPLATLDGSNATYYVSDHLGSMVQTTTASAVVALTRQYDPYGKLLSGGATGGYAFTGREWDSETGLYYYRARYYEPRVGRFIGEDPIRWGGDGPNFYAYVLNNPVNLTDPSGLESGDIWRDWMSPEEIARRRGAMASSGGGCCNQDWLTCMANCLARYDPLGPAGNTILTAAGGTFPKKLIGQPTVLGASRVTTIPSAAGGAAVRGVGRFFSPIWITYGNYLFFAEVHCAAACAGWACSY